MIINNDKHYYCDYCSKEIKGRNPASFKNKQNHFCNRVCFTEWRKENWKGKKAPQYRGGGKKVDCFCDYCGKTIKRFPCEIKKSKHFFCNIECRRKWHAENLVAKNAPNWRGGFVTVQCETCNEPLQRIQSEIRKREKFFCNKNCMGIWQSQNIVGKNHPMWRGNHISVICINCGNDFILPYWHAKRPGNKFCNGKCYGEWVSLNLTGNKRYNWKGGKLHYYGPNWGRQRNKARKRDNYTCQHCGITENDLAQQLHVHHIKPLKVFNYIAGQNENYKQANKLINLISLCCKCHRKHENKNFTTTYPSF